MTQTRLEKLEAKKAATEARIRKIQLQPITTLVRKMRAAVALVPSEAGMMLERMADELEDFVG